MMRFSVLCTAAALISCSAAYAQAGGPIPRTTEGKPDFQGVWTNSSITRLERVPEFKDLVISEADAKQWEMDAASVAAADNAPPPKSTSSCSRLRRRWRRRLTVMLGDSSHTPAMLQLAWVCPPAGGGGAIPKC